MKYGKPRLLTLLCLYMFVSAVYAEQRKDNQNYFITPSLLDEWRDKRTTALEVGGNIYTQYFEIGILDPNRAQDACIVADHEL